jgi:hypothetical protein
VAGSQRAITAATSRRRAFTALAVHALARLGDGYLSPSLADVTVRGRIGPACWKRPHRFTAPAPTALEAEVLAKAAVLAGPDAAPDRLVHGGVIVAEDGSHRVLEPAAVLSRA